MIEKALKGSKSYYTLIGVLLLFIGAGFIFYIKQRSEGLGITGLSRDVPWGLYIAQLTFLVGVAASAVMVVLPYYLHNYKEFGKLVILGEFLAVSAVIMCLTFVLADLGQIPRMWNLVFHPTLNSVLFWDMIVLNGYLFINLTVGFVTFGAESKGIAPPKWIKPIIYLSIPWAVSIHTVTAFLYAGLEGRPFWMTAILAPRFIASAFASGPCLLIILCIIVRKFTTFDPGKIAIQKLREIVTYALILNLFFLGVELFTVLYADMPEHMHHFEYMFFGLNGKTGLVPWMWTSLFMSITSLCLLFAPKIRENHTFLVGICAAIIAAIWIEKGMGMVVTGFVPNPFGTITEYSPTFPETIITLGIYAMGFLIITVLYKMVTTVRHELKD